MKIINKTILLLSLVTLFLSSCNFLDIVPEETSKFSDTYADKNKGRAFLYSCYSYLPNPQSGPASLDLMTGDEVVTAFEHETFAHFPKGTYTSTDPKISYWNTFFEGLRQCYTFLGVIDKLPNDTSQALKEDYKAQVKFLIAYYHYQLANCYGPIIWIDKEPDLGTKVEDYPGRISYEKAVELICNKFDEAAKGLPSTRPAPEVGLATKTAALAFKAKLLLYAASPLFNGGYDDGNGGHTNLFTGTKIEGLMPKAYSPEKWQKAKKAYEEAIKIAEAAGFALYDVNDYKIDKNSKPTGITRRMRTLILDWQVKNKEVIFSDPRNPGAYGIQNKSYPYVNGGNAWNGISPTWTMLNRFYTKNGLPWSVDPETKDLDKLSTLSPKNLQAGGHSDEAAATTIQFNLNREPRFYAWIGFQGGYYEINQAEPGVYNLETGKNYIYGKANNAYELPEAPEEPKKDDPKYKDDEAKYNEDYAKYEEAKAKYQEHQPAAKERTFNQIVLNFYKDGLQGRGSRKNDYAPSGYLNKKGCDPTIAVAKGGSQYLQYPWPLMRLADLYLGYAECCVETGELETAKQYLNKVRVRAGIPTVEESWAKVPGTNLNDKATLREIVRQERQIEFYLENQNFWDMRRWLTAEKSFSRKAEGMNIVGGNGKEFFKVVEIDFDRKFEAPKNYLLPIPIKDMQRNPKLVQNPGYE